MSLLSKLADRLVLCPSTQFIDPEDRVRVWIEADDYKIEAWTLRTTSDSDSPTDVLLLKFPGAGGRADRARTYPANVWSDARAEVWTINHRGYGQSTGPASLQNFAQSCELVWFAAKEKFPEHKFFLYGNSLGCLSALYLAARHQASALFLRNPPPLAQMIATRRRYRWWSFGLSKLVANQVPDDLDAVKNASRSTCPALFVCSEKDSVVPPEFQQLILDAYGGPINQFVIPGANHQHGVPESHEAQYLMALNWLWDNSHKSD